VPRSLGLHDSGLDQRQWWPGLRKAQPSNTILGRLFPGLAAWCQCPEVDESGDAKPLL
jgi:hypothetical protein